MKKIVLVFVGILAMLGITSIVVPSQAAVVQEVGDANYLMINVTEYKTRITDDILLAQTCGDGYEIFNGTCKPTQRTCREAEQIRNRNGDCEECPQSPERMRPYNNVCVSLMRYCHNNNQILNDAGVCERCPQEREENTCITYIQFCNRNGLIGVPLFGRAICRACQGATPVRNGNVCESCSVGQNSANSICQSVRMCNDEDKILSHGSCKPCEKWREREGNTCIVTENSCNNNNQIYVNDNCQSCTGSTPFRNGNRCVATITISDSGSSSNAEVIVGVGVAAVAAVWAFSNIGVLGTGVGKYTFSPYYHYQLIDDEVYRVGSRLDYRTKNWNLYWAAEQSEADFHYATGAKYDGGFWTATFNENIQNEIVDYDFSLSGTMQGSNWALSPIYRVRTKFEDVTTWQHSTRNSINLQGYWRYSQWTIKQSAGFDWQNFQDINDNILFDFSAVYEF